MRKKASLSLSINAIVVLVIAIVVLGIILGLVQQWFKKAGGEVPKLLEVPIPGLEADANDPFKMTSEVVVKTGETTKVQASYYNKAISTKTNVSLSLMSCKSVLGADIPAAELPVLVTIAAPAVEASTNKGFEVIMNTATEAGKVRPGEYLCQMAVISDEGTEEVDTFTLKVTQ